MHQKIKKVSSVRIGVIGMCFLLLSALLLQPVTLEAKIGHRSKSPKGFKFDFVRWPWPLHAEVCSRLQELARKYPKLARTHIIGKTREGRDLMVMEITNKETGLGISKPGMWMDGNIHGCYTGRLYLMYVIERLLFEYGKNPDVTRLVDTHTFYILPIWDADRGERTLTRHPAWPGHKPEQQTGKDLDGDGYITRMRVKDDSVEGGYRFYLEGLGIDPVGAVTPFMNFRSRNELTGERERPDFNRNWAGDWLPEESGAGPYPFSAPEVHAVADFITKSHKNIFFCWSVHSGGAGGEGRNYLVRPIMDEPYVNMHHEDNDFYVRAGAIWSYLSEGNVIENNYMSFLFNTSQEDEEGKQRGYGPTMAGFMTDYIYLNAGLHILCPEISGSAIDYDGDGYLTQPERERWHKEEMGNRWFSPWKPYNHSILGEVEIGGLRGAPPVFGERGKSDSEIQYDWLLYVTNLSPLLRIKDLTAEPISSGKYRVVATVRNEGCLSTYVTRRAIKIRRDYPAVAKIQVTGGKVVDGEEMKGLGHILGKWAYILHWIQGQDRSTKTVEWIIEPTGSGPVNVTVKAWAPKAGEDQKTITIKK